MQSQLKENQKVIELLETVTSKNKYPSHDDALMETNRNLSSFTKCLVRVHKSKTLENYSLK